MHRCLHIPEVVRLICEQFGIVNQRKTEQYNCLVALLRTCHALYEPALSYVWSDIASLVPLLKCMPEDLWTIEKNCFKLKREIRPTDWSRFKKHARLVRGFGFIGWLHFPKVDISAYQSLHLAASGQTVLPNINRLSCSIVVSEEALPYISLFMSPDLLKFSFISCRATTSAHLSFIANLSIWYPTLTDVDIWIRHPNARAVISTTVVGWSGLRRLDVNSISTDAFIHIAALPNLRHLSLTPRGDHGIELPQVHHTPFFPALQEISLTSQDLSFCSQFLRLMSPGSALLHISFVSEDSLTDVSIWRELLSTLEVICLPFSLQKVHIADYSEWSASEIDMGIAFADLVIQTDVIKPLFRFYNLSHVRLSACNGFDFDDHFVEELAMAWPNLESLRIEEERKPNGHPQVTLSSLISFGHHCRHMTSLCMTFDAATIPTYRPNVKISSPSLVVLGVGYSPISSPPKVAAFISDVFPNIATITNHDKVFREAEVPETALDIGWSEVEYLIPIFAAVREEESTRTRLALVSTGGIEYK